MLSSAEGAVSGGKGGGGGTILFQENERTAEISAEGERSLRCEKGKAGAASMRERKENP